jgi:hypothetical protein
MPGRGEDIMDTDQPDVTPPTNPVEHDFAEEATPTKWPKVIGVISLVYALGGLLCQVTGFAWLLLSDWLMRMGGMDLELPPVIRIVGAASTVLGFCLGVVLLFGALNLLRRRRKGVKLHKTWAMLRIVLLVVGLGAGMVMLPAQIEFQRAALEANNKRMREAGRSDLVQEFDRETVWRQSVISTGVMNGLVAVYPVFIVFYLSRKKIDQEIEQWD